MTLVNFTPSLALMGGIFVGLASGILLLFSGKIFGISGFCGGLLSWKKKDRLWRILSMAGLILGAFLTHLIFKTPDQMDTVSTPRLIIAGLLVGFGTRLGSGCTSGHGVCGLSRGSKRSLMATLTFMLMGLITVYFFPYA